MKQRRLTRPGPVYVAAVTALAAVAFRDPRHVQREAEVATIVLTLPTFLVLLPLVYAGLAASQHIFAPQLGEQTSTGRAWPLAIIYVAMFGGLSLLQLWVVTRVRANRRARQHRRRPPWPEPWPVSNTDPTGQSPPLGDQHQPSTATGR